MEKVNEPVQPDAAGIYSHLSLQRSLEGNGDQVFTDEQLEAIGTIDVLLHDIPGQFARDIHSAVHLLASSGSPNQEIRRSAVREIEQMKDYSECAITALKKIRDAVGTNTQAWHWADNVLKSAQAVSEQKEDK